MSKSTPHYPAVEPNPDFATLEESILKFWEESRAFEKSVERRLVAGNSYVFYDGPPFANGLPHYGHLLTGYVKDAIARYQTMRGKRVERRFGWDCHGLPAEMAAEKELGISGRAAIQQYGIDKFNEHCRTSVMKYVEDWRYYVTRQGRWVDFDNDYKTMDIGFMESVLWAFKQLFDKGLVYESMRVMPYSWAAETPVSNFETRIDNATREREDKAVYVKFKLKVFPQSLPEAKNHYLVAWTTTPWTLPSNLALAVNKALEYACIVIPAQAGIHATTGAQLSDMDPGLRRGDVLVVGASAAAKLAEQLKGKIVSIIKGSDLIGAKYEPLFPYFKDTPNAFTVIDGGENVTEGDGTSVLHVAPGFGEVDQVLATANGIETITPVDEKGRFEDAIYDLPDLSLEGLTVVADTRVALADITVSDEDKAKHIEAKDIAKYGLANMRITRWLKANGHLVKDEPYKHNYPHCWRTDTPLIYRAMSSWYVAVTKIKDKMVKNNAGIHWIPDHVRDGQMGKGIESAPDWSISRNRFWGTPIPIWRSPSGKLIVPGSIEEIEKLSGKKVNDLHRPYIDAITFTKDGEEYTRVEDVFDCWFESGSMPYAQLHYPFANKDKFEANFPADFITEYIAQTRGWFYTLQVLSAALFDCAPFKHVICHGVVIDEETGLKYSKRLKNYRDPKEVMDQYGADALRWMMLASPVMRGADLAVDPDGKFIRDVVRLNIKPIWNAYNFFTLYANADGVKARDLTPSPLAGEGRGEGARSKADSNLTPPPPNLPPQGGEESLLDRYILAKCKAAVEQVKQSLDAYDTPGATEAITGFFEILNNWYIRRSRPRFWAEKVDADKQAAYDTLYTALTLMVKAAAPLLPFTCEAVFQGLNGKCHPVTSEASAQDLNSDPAQLLRSSQDDGKVVSVHWQDFPDVSNIEEDIKLTMVMDYVRDLCNAVLAIRNKNNLRVRLPLQKITIVGAQFGNLSEYAEMIRDEINVKEIHLENDFEKYATKKLAIVFPVLAKRLPDKIKQITPAAKKGEWRKEGRTIYIAGEEIRDGEECTIQSDPKPEFKDVAQSFYGGEALVILDINVTEDLEAEGRARDLVRMVQQARKDGGFDVSDRITLALDVPAAFQSAIAAHGDYIKEQTLAVSIAAGKTKSDKEITQELDGETFTIGISKAA